MGGGMSEHDGTHPNMVLYNITTHTTIDIEELEALRARVAEWEGARKQAIFAIEMTLASIDHQTYPNLVSELNEAHAVLEERNNLDLPYMTNTPRSRRQSGGVCIPGQT
jgi:hypothetical protein